MKLVLIDGTEIDIEVDSGSGDFGAPEFDYQTGLTSTVYSLFFRWT
jgi:hypothetical protein